MKKILFFLLALCPALLLAQEKLPVVYLPADQTIHFVSPEPVQYVDISSKAIIGDLPLKNVVRLKLRDTAAVFSGAVITIAGEKFIAQYRLLPGFSGVPSQINIEPGDTKPLDISGIGLSQNQLRAIAFRLIARRPGKSTEKSNAFGMKAKLNHLYTVGDYIFLDLAYHNKTNIRFDIADFRFKVDDKSVTKAANNQSVEIKPEFTLLSPPSFSKSYRNIFVLKKMTFPGNKVLRAELSEQQLSGRVITLSISYQDILDADTLPN